MGTKFSLERLKELKQQVFDDFQLYEVRMRNSFSESMKEATPTGEMDEVGNALTVLIDEAIARQSATSEEVRDAISHIQGRYGDIWQWPKKRRDMIIAALQEYQPWVSVKDGLPDDGIPVLVTYIGRNDKKFHSDGVAIWCDKQIGYGGEWLWELDRSEAADEITHWKPLPEPPKGETT